MGGEFVAETFTALSSRGVRGRRGRGTVPSM